MSDDLQSQPAGPLTSSLILRSSQGLRKIWRSEVDEIYGPIGSRPCTLHVFGHCERDIVSLVIITNLFHVDAEQDLLRPELPPSAHYESNKKAKGMREAVVASRPESRESNSREVATVTVDSEQLLSPSSSPVHLCRINSACAPSAASGRYRRFNQPRSARAHARDHPRQGTHFVRLSHTQSVV